MAIGDAFRIMGGIYIPNPRFLRCTNFRVGRTENLPDRWSKANLGGGQFQINVCEGFSDHRAMRVFSQPGSSVYNEVISGPSPSGSVPIRHATTAFNVNIRVVMMYRKSSALQSFEPYIVIYSAQETASYTKQFTSVSAQATNWTKYDSVVAVPINLFDLAAFGFSQSDPPDHIRFGVKIGNSAVAATMVFDDVTVGWQLLNPGNGTPTGYDALSMRPKVAGLKLNARGLGETSRTSLGQYRYTDQTGGTLVNRFEAEFPASTPTDRKLLEAAWELNRGVRSAELGIVGTPFPSPSSPVVSQPFVMEPFHTDIPTQSHGRQPESFYGYFTSEPEWEPRGYLGNAWTGPVVVEEVG